MRKRRGAISARLAESPMKRGELGRAEHASDAAWRMEGPEPPNPPLEPTARFRDI